MAGRNWIGRRIAFDNDDVAFRAMPLPDLTEPEYKIYAASCRSFERIPGSPNRGLMMPRARSFGSVVAKAVSGR